jgi:hypothetical protein
MFRLTRDNRLQIKRVIDFKKWTGPMFSQTRKAQRELGSWSG